MKILWILILSTILSYSNLVKADNQSLTLGIFPYVSTSKLIAHNNTVVKHINETTNYDLSLVTAKDASTYLSNLKNYEYDLIFSAPHIARFVEKNFGYQRVVMTTHTIRGVYLVKKDSPIHSFNDLKGKKISMADEQTILHQIAISELIDHGIIPDKDIQIKTVNTHNNAIYDVLKDESDAAITGFKIWKNLPADKKKQLRQLALSKATTGFIVLAKPDINKEMIKNIQNSFLSFNGSSDGKPYIFRNFRLIRNSDMESLDFYAKVFE